MPKAAVRANARTLPKSTLKPETAKAFVLRTLDAETRRLAALPDKAFERKTPSPSAEHSNLFGVTEDLVTVRHLLEAAWMAAHILKPEDRDPLTHLLDVVDDKLRAATDNLMAIREARTVN